MTVIEEPRKLQANRNGCLVQSMFIRTEVSWSTLFFALIAECIDLEVFFAIACDLWCETPFFMA